MSEWKEPWSHVYNLMARTGVRPVRGLDKPLRYCTARECLRARIVTTAAAARELLADMETRDVLRSTNLKPQAGGKTVIVYVTPNDTWQLTGKTIVT